MTEGAAFLNRLDRACETWTQLNPQEFTQLVRELQRVPPGEQFDLLAQAFVSDHYLRQEYAGRILTLLNPPCTESVDDLLPRLLPGWNRSVEQLPRYLAATFGRDAVLSALDEIETSGDPGSSKADTVRYWLRLFQDKQGP